MLKINKKLANSKFYKQQCFVIKEPTTDESKLEPDQ